MRQGNDILSDEEKRIQEKGLTAADKKKMSDEQRRQEALKRMDNPKDKTKSFRHKYR